MHTQSSLVRQSARSQRQENIRIEMSCMLRERDLKHEHPDIFSIQLSVAITHQKKQIYPQL